MKQALKHSLTREELVIELYEMELDLDAGVGNLQAYAQLKRRLETITELAKAKEHELYQADPKLDFQI